MKPKILILSIVIVILFAIIAFKPISFSKNNFENSKGKVSKIYEGGINDVVFELEDNKATFYINRGLENNFNLETLNKELIGKEVSINYSIGWTPLDPFNKRSKSIIELKKGEKLIFKN
ncbi:MAG: hypothetical protein ABWZ56_09700 [Flavobacterium sp.]